MHLPDPDLQPEFYAGVQPKRFFAWLIDSAIILGISLLAIPFTGFTAIFYFFALMAIVNFVYRTATLASGSATWGMRFVGIELRVTDGQRLDTSTAAMHTLGYMVSFAFFLLQVISVALMLITARGQGLTDHLLGTTMLNRRAAAYLN